MNKRTLLMGLWMMAVGAGSAFGQTVPLQVLMVVTSSPEIRPGEPTGLWLEEFAVPYLKFVEAGFDVTVASPLGGKAPVDPRSLKDGQQVLDWARAAVELEQTVKLASLTEKRFDAVFLPGGHGTMFDFPDDAALKTLLDRTVADKGVVSAVCHGPAGLVAVVKPNGTPLVAGKTVTAFTNAEERAGQLDDDMPFLLESRLRELGAEFVEGPLWQSHIQVDGLLVTGQNPASSGAAADAVVGLLRSR